MIRALLALLLGSLTLLVAVGSVAYLRADYRHKQEIRALKLELIDLQARRSCGGKPRWVQCMAREIERRAGEM